MGFSNVTVVVPTHNERGNLDTGLMPAVGITPASAPEASVTGLAIGRALPGAYQVQPAARRMAGYEASSSAAMTLIASP
jgi:hypothetical protein